MSSILKNSGVDINSEKQGGGFLMCEEKISSRQREICGFI